MKRIQTLRFLFKETIKSSMVGPFWGPLVKYLEVHWGAFLGTHQVANLREAYKKKFLFRTLF